MGSRFWSRLCYYCSKWFRTKHNNQPTRKTPAAWQLLLSQRPNFLNNHLARVPITPNQEGTMQMRDEVLSSVGAQDLDNSSYQVSDLEDIEFNWEGWQLDIDAVFRPGIDTPSSPTTFEVLSMGGNLKTPLCWTKSKTRRFLLPHSINTGVCQTHGTSQAAEKLSIWSRNRKCSWLCL